MTEPGLFPGLATGIGSLPHQEMAAALELIFKFAPDAPHWPQLQSLRYTESMEVQPSEGLPGARHRPEKRSVYVDTASGEAELAAFYEKALAVEAGDLESFAISADYASGFHAFLAALRAQGRRYPLVKAQLVGPFTFGFSIPDQDGRAIFYHPAWSDAALDLLSLKARWQLKLLAEFADRALFFLDEPMLSAYGSSAMLTVSREEVIEKLGRVIDPLRAAGAIVGMHCCGNTDWGLVMETRLDVVNFDAYQYGSTVAIYAEQANRFLERGGWFAVGIVPTSAAIDHEDERSLADRLGAWIAEMIGAGVDETRLRRQLIITPSCGCGTLKIAQAEKVYGLLARLQESYRG